MYQIKCDDHLIHDVRIEGLQVISPKCNIQLNKTGSLTFQIPPTHIYYDVIKKHTSEITLYQDNTVLFCGRVLNDEIDFYNIKTIECEGDLSYLIDSIQRYKEYHLGAESANVIETYLKDLIAIHNSQVDARKRFQVGLVTVSDTNNYLYKISNYQNTLYCITDKLINTYGGYLSVRYSNGVKYLDYVAELVSSSSQKIEFGKNLIDMTRYIKGEDIFTALIPLGSKVESDEETEKRIGISTVPDARDGTIVKNDDYVYDSEAVEKWGWIWKSETWDDVTIPGNLYSKAKSYLTAATNESFVIELTAIDLHLLSVNIDKITLGDKIQVVSIPHNIDMLMIVEKMEIDIDNPQNTKVTLTLPNNFKLTDTSYSNAKAKSDKEIKDVQELIANDVVTVEELKALDDKYLKGDSDIKSVDALKEWTDDTHLKTVPEDTIKTVTDLKDWTSNNHLKLTPDDGIESVGDIKQWVKDNTLSSKNPDGTSIDLSEYAKIADVNNAFNQLASALGGV